MYNELISSPDDEGLLGARHANTNDVIISDTILRSLSPPQLSSMTDNHKIMRCCAICQTSKYFQELLNASQRKQFKNMKDKADNSRRRKKVELTQAYKLYADYAVPDNETCHPCFENAADSILCTPTNYECRFPHWKCALRKSTACTSIDLQGVEIF